MRVAYFDPIGGAAGDMVLGAFLDAGLALSALEDELQKLPLHGYTLSSHKVRKQSIMATQFLVHVEAEDHHHHDHDHNHEHGRRLSEIRQLIRESALEQRTKDRALAIFERLGQAEAKVHGVALDDVHFHEVGAIDSIVDIVGAAVAVDLLGLERIFCAPLPMGHGLIETAHGTFPVPAPATLELAASAGAPVLERSVDAEQVTPTGAAILTTLASFERPAMNLGRVGYGSGESDLSIPNVLRVWIGESDDGGGRDEELAVVSANIDDMNPQLYGPVLEGLFKAGAKDAWLVPVIMKKGRPGVEIRSLCAPGDAESLRQVLLRETTTLGVRTESVQRRAADRDMVQVETQYGVVTVKLKLLDGKVAGAAPEFEDCRLLAAAQSRPVLDVYQAALAAAQSMLGRRV